MLEWFQPFLTNKENLPAFRFSHLTESWENSHEDIQQAEFNTFLEIRLHGPIDPESSMLSVQSYG